MNPINDEIKEFLNLKTHPARLNREQAAALLGFEPHQIPVIVQEGLLKPLGRPAQNGEKFFASAELAKLKHDKEWLSKATLAVSRYYQKKNARKGKTENAI
jgi:hypothetical protein